MHRLVRDALNSALQKLGFPWLTPHPTKTSHEIGYFQKTITPNDLYELYKRHQMAHSIVFDVAYDALAAGFNITDLEGELNKELDQQVKKVYTEKIHLPLLKTYVRARLYGSAGLLLGYADVRGFDRPANTKNKIKYFYSIPNRWVADIAAEKDQAGNTTLPLKLDHYELSTPTSVSIDASRIVHIQPPSIEEDFSGESCLHHIFDVLTVLKNMDWSTGQTMFRHGAGFTSIVAGPGADQAQIDAIDNVVSEINAKTVITFPPGTEITTHRPGALDPEKYYYVICAQIAAGSNIPLSILMGTPKGARESSQKDRKDYADFLAGIQKNVLTVPLQEIIARLQTSGQLPQNDFLIQWNTPSIFLIDVARGTLYEAQAETEKAKAERERAQALFIQAQTRRTLMYEQNGEQNEKDEEKKDD